MQDRATKDTIPFKGLVDPALLSRLMQLFLSGAPSSWEASFFNMSGTLSRGVIEPDPDNFGARPLLYINPPAATSACLSDARLCSLISARGASLRWAIRCYGWGYLGRFDSLVSRVAPWALAEKEPGVRPNGLGSDRRMGWIALCRDSLPEG